MASTVEALALRIRGTFPELESRAFAVTEASFSKENMPRLPICMVACIGETAEDGARGPSRTLITEDIVAEFWLPLNRYRSESGGESPFYAYQDYGKIRDALLNSLHDWSAPSGVQVSYQSMEIEVTDYALCVGFRLQCQWHWCPDPIAGSAESVLKVCISHAAPGGQIPPVKPERDCD